MFAALTNSARKARTAQAAPLATGIVRLDRLLDGGFPRAAVTEILPAAEGRGEVEMILPALAELGSACWILPVLGSFEPFAPALEEAGIDLTAQLFLVPGSAREAFRTAEKAAASGEAGAVVAWLPPLAPEEDERAMNRLALAAELSGTCVFVYRPASMICARSPAKIRLQLSPAGGVESRVRATLRRTFFDAVKAETMTLLPQDEIRAVVDAAGKPLGCTDSPALAAGFGI